MLTESEKQKGVNQVRKLCSCSAEIAAESATLCRGLRRRVTCGSPPGAGVVLVGAGLANCRLHPAPLGRR